MTHPDVEKGSFSVLHFRNFFTTQEQSIKINISADIRYKLYLNGEYIGQGPANNDLRHYSYDSYALSEHLVKGENLLAVEVWSFGEMNPARFESERARLIVMSETAGMESLNTGSGNWKVTESKAYASTHRGKDFQFEGYYAMGGGELINAAEYLWGWNLPTHDDKSWYKPVTLSQGTPYGYAHNNGEAYISLSPRTIPMMDESPENRPQLRQVKGMPAAGATQNWDAAKPMLIPEKSEVTFLFDQAYLTKGHPFFAFSQGKGAVVEITYAENLFYPDGTKGNRNEIEGKEIRGLKDRYILDGGQGRIFSPLLNRTWRYIEVKIKTGLEPLQWVGYSARKFIYPFNQTASFQSGVKLHNQILEAGWRTAKLCADETYMDTPYYEQLQYIGDTRIQALISLYYSGDDRLMRNAIHQFSNSITDEGITQSRFPSNIIQYIPPYSLFMINMLHDYHMHRNDDAFTGEYVEKMSSILFWFEKQLREDMLLGAMPWWSYVDVTKDWKGGSPPAFSEGGSIVLTLQFIYALQEAVSLYKYHGKYDLANHFEQLSAQLQEAVKQKGFDSQRGLFADTPEKKQFSQHANIFAILTNTAAKEAQSDLFHRIITDTSLTQANVYFQFYLIRAAQRSGNGSFFTNNLSMWEGMLNEGLTTYAEHLHRTRSDCHAWSATPNYEFFNTVLGIQPYAPHFEEVLIEPNPGNLNNVKGKIPHPKGEIGVSLSSVQKNMRVEINLPPETTGVFKWKNKEYPLVTGINKFRISDLHN
ncbi:alpha-L-rhamnosidase [Flammeovirgaceae bacterium 311]|nr:alpha-L-rhamnosidase [Flammeovirgaceae bacterium 311]